MASTALVSLTDLKTFLGGSIASSEDSALQDMIDMATALIEKRIGCNVIDREVVEYHEGGSRFLFAQHPVASVTSVIAPDDALTEITSDYFYIEPRGTNIRHGSHWPIPYTTSGVRGKWTLTYVGGLMTKASPDLALACCKLVSWLYEKRGTSPDVSSVSVGSLSLSYSGGRAVAGALPDEVESLIAPYLRISIA